mmetsp:Transcript_11813/g.31887  ORF Transcript_11813/g.31887 Transcript_11813/m.31887 type:complete len:100 (+) Transcript_11813:77-376(+)
MSQGPLLWERVHAHHNPFTGSYHSPPGSALLAFSDGEPTQHLSSPPAIFPLASVLPADRPSGDSASAGESWRGRDPLQLFCSMCCPALAGNDQDEFRIH